MALLAKRLGIDPSNVSLCEDELKGDVYAQCLSVDPVALAETLRDRIKLMGRFADDSKQLSKLVEDLVDYTAIYAQHKYVQKYAPAGLTIESNGKKWIMSKSMCFGIDGFTCKTMCFGL